MSDSNNSKQTVAHRFLKKGYLNKLGITAYIKNLAF